MTTKGRELYELFLERNPGFHPVLNPPPTEKGAKHSCDNLCASDARILSDYIAGMKAIHNLHEEPAVKYGLLDRGYRSSAQIFQMPEREFVNSVQDEIGTENAKAVYSKARDNHILLSHVLTALRTFYGSSHYRMMGGAITGLSDDISDDIFENIPNYVEIFSNTQYCRCEESDSVFGPAAYFVDLLRIIEKYIILQKDEEKEIPIPLQEDEEKEIPIPLQERRPDLFHIKLDEKNTNRVEPYLQIVNRILEKSACAWLGAADVKSLYQKLSMRYYPLGLPFHLPLSMVRAWTEQAGVGLWELYEAWSADERLSAEVIDAEKLGLQKAYFDSLSHALSDELIAAFYGVASINLVEMAKLPAFESAVGISEQELSTLLKQELDEEEKGRVSDFFINRGLGKPLSIKSGPDGLSLDGLTNAHLDRLCRFLRVSRILDADFELTDWLVRVTGSEAGELPLGRMKEILELSKSAGIEIYTLSAMLGPMKDYGKNNLYKKVFQQTAEESEDSSVLKRAAARSLGISAGDFEVLWQGLLPSSALPLKKEDKECLYRHVKAAELLRLSIEDYLVFLDLCEGQRARVFTVEALKRLDRTRKALKVNVCQLQYIVSQIRSPRLKADFTVEGLEKRIDALRDKLPADYRDQKALLRSYVDTELADFLDVRPDELSALLSCVLNGDEAEKWADRVAFDEDRTYIIARMEELGGWLLLLRSGIGLPLIRTAASCPNAFGMGAACKLTVYNVCCLFAVTRFMEAFGDTEYKLLKFIEGFTEGSADLELLSQIAGWNQAHVETLYPKLAGDEKNVARCISRLKGGMDILKRLTADPAIADKLLSMADNSDLRYDALLKTAQDIVDAETDVAVQGKIEGLKRDALMGVALLELKKRYNDINSYDKLYKYFLIDVEMDDKTTISPIKEGINAAQLYLQRCRLGLEKGIEEIDFSESWWSWLMSYSTWVANRNIFVYPENYLLPSIRQSKSSLFCSVEDALQQAKITDGYVEEQYVRYLDDYLQLTQVKVCGAYATEIDHKNVLYLFGRTIQQPYSYYFCTKTGFLPWTEWEKIDANIDSVNMTPVFVFNRLHIFWTTIKESAMVTIKSEDQLNADNQKTYSLEIKYTYLNLQGKWIVPQTLVSDEIIYADKDASEKREGFGDEISDTLDMENDCWKKLTLLRLTKKNLEGFIDKDGDYECLAVITGPVMKNIAVEAAQSKAPDTAGDSGYAAYVKRLNTLIQQNNFEVNNMENGYFCTGFLKIFNEDLEEEHFIQKNEFIVLDGYIPTKYALTYTPLYDEVHRAVGVYYSQSVLRDAALPAAGILPAGNNMEGRSLPKLSDTSFIFKKPGAEKEYIISAEESKLVFKALQRMGIITQEGYTSEKKLASANLMEILVELYEKNPYDIAKYNQITEIERILLKNIGAVYLFDKVERAAILPVVNQPGWFIYDCGDEAFLVYPVYKNSEGTLLRAYFRKTDMGVTIGVPVTKFTFMRLGLGSDTADGIVRQMTHKGLLNPIGILNLAKCTRKALEDSVGYLLDEGKRESMLAAIYMKLQNFPIATQSLFSGIQGISEEDAYEMLIGQGILCETQSVTAQGQNGKDTLCRVDLGRMKERSDAVYTVDNVLVSESAVSAVYGRLLSAVSSINFNYRQDDSLPKELRTTPFSEWTFGVERLTNPTIKKLKKRLEHGGIDAFLNLKTQGAAEPPLMPISRLGPTKNIVLPQALDGAQVDFQGLYGNYNWELFYHIPMAIAECFRANGQYGAGNRWFQYIFNPASHKEQERYYWNFKPFTEAKEETLKTMLKNTEAIATCNDQPFDPHAIAGLRIGAYEKYTVMQYISNIMEWGDRYFAQNTWEGLTSATMMYVWASDLLGPRPRETAVVKERETLTYAELAERCGEIPEFIIELEKKLQEYTIGNSFAFDDKQIIYNDIDAYFGVPENSQLIGYWDLVEDRLYKIRNSLDLNGAPRTMLLFEAPLDALQAARMSAAAAQGGGGLERASQLYPYRFTYIIAQAKYLAGQLIQLGSALLSAMEKKDGEELSLLSSTQERSLLDMMTAVKKSQIDEISASISSLEATRSGAVHRAEVYASRAEEYMSGKEIAAMVMMDAAAIFETIAGSIKFAAGTAYLAPQVGSPFAMKYGGAEIGASLETVSTGYGILASVSNHVMENLLTMAQYDRRREEWETQKEQAESESASLAAQIDSAVCRRDSARQELDIHLRTISQKDAVYDFLSGKFTNKELYTWITGRLNSTLWQTYQLAMELSLAAQESYRFERDDGDTFIRFDYWDDSRKGMQAGEGLMLSLCQMEQAYMKKNTRLLEIEKNISLALTNTSALMELKNSGVCQFTLDEALFARDYPACYGRKIVSISLTMPALLPPYETVKATLRQTDSYTLLRPTADGISYLFGLEKEKGKEDVKRIQRGGEKIALSKGINDSGLFVLSFSDERYLPFEGTGAHSSWMLEMPKKSNKLDFNTISDVIITVKYSALEDEQRGSGSFCDSVLEKLELIPETKVNYCDVSSMFRGGWNRFLAGESGEIEKSFHFELKPSSNREEAYQEALLRIGFSEESAGPEEGRGMSIGLKAPGGKWKCAEVEQGVCRIPVTGEKVFGEWEVSFPEGVDRSRIKTLELLLTGGEF